MRTGYFVDPRILGIYYCWSFWFLQLDNGRQVDYRFHANPYPLQPLQKELTVSLGRNRATAHRPRPFLLQDSEYPAVRE